MMGLNNPRVLKRFIILLAVATFVMFSIWAMINNYKDTTKGDFEVRQGDIFLQDSKYEKAIKAFERALMVQPNHRGALGGQAIALMGLKKDDEAENLLTYLINYLLETLPDDDATGRGALSAAHANRGILRDRQGRYEEALKDYIESARIDRGLAEGPGMVQRLLYYANKPSSVIKRAEYIYKQLKLPKAERVMRRPEEDEKQRRYKP